MKKLFSLLLVFAMILSLCACGGNEKNSSNKATIFTNDNKSVQMSAEDLFEVYDSNEAKFNKLYYRAKIEFEGTIKSIEMDRSVIVESGSVMGVGADGGASKIVFEEGWCLVVDANNTEIDLADFDKGDTVKVTSGIVGAPFNTDYIKKVCDNSRVVWLVGDDVTDDFNNNAKFCDIKTTIQK